MIIVARIRAHGGDVSRDGYGLVLRRGRLPDAAVAWLKQDHVRAELLREVWPDADDWMERAAIREFDGGQDRETAEREAYREIAGC